MIAFIIISIFYLFFLQQILALHSIWLSWKYASWEWEIARIQWAPSITLEVLDK